MSSSLDLSAIITKTQHWNERDKAFASVEERLSNAVVKEYVADKIKVLPLWCNFKK